MAVVVSAADCSMQLIVMSERRVMSGRPPPGCGSGSPVGPTTANAPDLYDVAGLGQLTTLVSRELHRTGLCRGCQRLLVLVSERVLELQRRVIDVDLLKRPAPGAIDRPEPAHALLGGVGQELVL
jgi:hypothetical protein